MIKRIKNNLKYLAPSKQLES